MDAASGALLPVADERVAAATASAWFGGAYPVRYAGAVDEDVYTHSRALDPHRPLHRVDAADPDHTRLYISSATGAVVLDATRAERAWNYVGAWIHWLYPFRGNALDRWWHDIVVWLSVAGVTLALTGTVVGLMRWRFAPLCQRQPLAVPREHDALASSERPAVRRRHHHLDLQRADVDEPLETLRQRRRPLAQAAYEGPPAPAATLAAPAALIAALPAAPRELSWTRAAGQSLVQARMAAGAPLLLSAREARPAALDPAVLRAAAATLLPGARLAEVQTLERYDFYYYARDEHAMLGHVEKPLPAWRLVYDNPEASWVYLDPATGQLISRQDRANRASRWLFAFLHSWDWTGLLARRPLWDALLIFLSLGGAALSLTGVVIGWRRLGKKLRH